MTDPAIPHQPVTIYFCSSCGAHWPHMGSRKASQRAALHHAAGHVVYVTERNPCELQVSGVTVDGKPVAREDVRNVLAADAEQREPIYWCRTCGWSIAQDMSEQTYQDMLDHQGLGHLVVVTEADVRELRATGVMRTDDERQQIRDAIDKAKRGEQFSVQVGVAADLQTRGRGKLAVIEPVPVHAAAPMQNEEQWQELG